MEVFKKVGVLGFIDDGLFLMDSNLIMEVMIKVKELDVLFSFYEEDFFLVGNLGVNVGKVVLKLGLKGVLSVVEDVMVVRDCMLVLKIGVKVDI